MHGNWFGLVGVLSCVWWLLLWVIYRAGYPRTMLWLFAVIGVIGLKGTVDGMLNVAPNPDLRLALMVLLLAPIMWGWIPLLTILLNRKRIRASMERNPTRGLLA
jgi:hypothetical protein